MTQREDRGSFNRFLDARCEELPLSKAQMPTPGAHAIAGLAAAFLCNSAARRPGLSPSVLLAAAAVAVAPDLDLLLPWTHRTYTHSLGGVVLAGFGVWLILRRRIPNAAAATLAIAAGHASHLLLDWLGTDTSDPPGLMALWPFSTDFFLSGYDLFAEVSRRYWRLNDFVVWNLKALAWELVVLTPLLLVAWIIWSGRTVQRRNASG
jgi:inner membrane protein